MSIPPEQPSNYSILSLTTNMGLALYLLRQFVLSLETLEWHHYSKGKPSPTLFCAEYHLSGYLKKLICSNK